MSVFDRLLESLEAQHAVMTIIRSERIGSHIQDIVLQLPKGVTWDFVIGSYIQVMIGGCIPRCYSVAEFDGRSCRIIVSFGRPGVGARFFASASVGTQVRVYGPFDDFPYRPGTDRPKMFFATGTGVAPFRLMVEEALAERLPTLLLFGGPELPDLAYHEDFTDLAKKNPHFHYIPVLSRPSPSWKGERGYITHVAEDHANLIPQCDIYVCGVPPMVEGVEVLLKKYRVPTSQIFIQKFG